MAKCSLGVIINCVEQLYTTEVINKIEEQRFLETQKSL